MYGHACFVVRHRKATGANTPGNTSIHGMATSAVNRYPIAIARRANRRRIENWANSRTAVIKSTTNMGCCMCRDEALDPRQLDDRERPDCNEKATSNASTIARAGRHCGWAGDTLESIEGSWNNSGAQHWRRPFAATGQSKGRFAASRSALICCDLSEAAKSGRPKYFRLGHLIHHVLPALDIGFNPSPMGRPSQEDAGLDRFSGVAAQQRQRFAASADPSAPKAVTIFAWTYAEIANERPSHSIDVAKPAFGSNLL